MSRAEMNAGADLPGVAEAGRPIRDKRLIYFEHLAGEWDRIMNLERITQLLSVQLRRLGIAPSEMILDLGCGTGTSTRLLADFVTDGGGVWAIDFSPRMIERARQKVHQSAVRWVVGRAEELPLPDDAMERIVCFSAWSHFRRPLLVVRELARVLKPRGRLDILHVDPRQRINDIHTAAGGAIAGDLLPPAREIAALLEQNGFRVTSCVDDEREYVLTARNVSC